MNRLLFFFGLLFCFSLASAALNPTVTVSQVGADDGTVILGKEFIVRVSVSDSANEATISFGDFDNAFSVAENRTRSMSGTSVSWTVTPVLDVDGVQATVRVSSSSSGASGSSSVFDVVTSPNLVVSASPSSLSVDSGNDYVINVNVQNWGETSASDVVASINLGGTGMSLGSGVSSSQSLGVISGGLGGTGGSKSASWIINSGSAPSSGSITISVSSSNTDSKIKVIPVSSSYVAPQSSSNVITGGFISIANPSISVVCPDSIKLGVNDSVSFDVLINNTGSVMMGVFYVNFSSNLTTSVNPFNYSSLLPGKSVNSTITIKAGNESGNFTGYLNIYSGRVYNFSKTIFIKVIDDEVINDSLMLVVVNDSDYSGDNDLIIDFNSTDEEVLRLIDRAKIEKEKGNISGANELLREAQDLINKKTNDGYIASGLVIGSVIGLGLLIYFKREFFLKLIKR